MKPKKIWMLSMLIASIFTILFYFYINATTANSENTASAQQQQQQSNKSTKTNQSTKSEKTTTKPKEKLKIAANKRAISIAVDHVKGVSGLIRPGNYVDIIAFIPESAKNPETTEILLEEIKVLAVGSQTDKTIKNIDPAVETTFTYPTVTVEVTPDEALAIANVSVKGSLTMMLRQNPETTKTSTKGETTNDN
ncbi:Flp pilus assembly protein CpaB [Bacillus sp. DNRA2]|uniref:Flp pilus assembly protein CpaB n=1 Tax=Bacillus sp. DNRA2 TaxID=2723053 RepID=UPI00145E26BB|nr:Flp pilus assembly protein CpaB [Bacillus sp. DNRA2]NMD70120.1 Flp pilus assembly protein CpaB [Bacillus sp. DNRA2]